MSPSNTVFQGVTFISFLGLEPAFNNENQEHHTGQ